MSGERSPSGLFPSISPRDVLAGRRATKPHRATQRVRTYLQAAGLLGLLAGFGAVALAQNPARPGATPPAQAVALAPDTGRLPADKRYMPSSISEPLMSMTIQVVKETPGECVYRSRHFEFTSPVKLGEGSMKEICRSFESTFELVSKLPWGINPWPEDGRIFRSQFYQTRADYIKTGAPEWSAGIYSPKDGLFRIPFEEIGLKNRGNDFYLGGPINNDTITHEVTHQMMHEYLRFMPIWMAEGLAEYTANLPYNSGRYNVSAAVDGFKQMRKNFGKVKQRGLTVRAGTPPHWVGAETLWGFTTSIIKSRVITDLNPDPPKTPNPGTGIMTTVYPGSGVPPDILDLPNRYFSSHALIFFFMHLDGDGKGTRLKRFFDAIHEERKVWATFNSTTMAAYKEAVRKYEEEWEVFRHTPGVVDMGDGMLRYPSSLKPPAEPTRPTGPGGIDPTKVCARHLDILLDGRSLSALDREVRAAFSKAESPL